MCGRQPKIRNGAATLVKDALGLKKEECDSDTYTAGRRAF